MGGSVSLVAGNTTMSEDEEFHHRQERLTRQIFQSEDMLPSRYVYVLTNACNLKCDFCFQDKRPKEKNMKAKIKTQFDKQIAVWFVFRVWGLSRRRGWIRIKISSTGVCLGAALASLTH